MVKKPEGALIQIEIHSGPLKKSKHKALKGIGAKLTFIGIVRPDENGKTISALRYDMIRPLVDSQLGRLASETAQKHELRSILAQHSEGIVPVGKPSFCLIMSATHREKLFPAMQVFINEMKRFVAISKRPVYQDPRVS